MVRGVILGLVAAGVLLLCYVGYRSWSEGRDMMSGEVRNGPAEPGDADATPTIQTALGSATRRDQTAKESARFASGVIGSSARVDVPAAVPTVAPQGDTIAPNPPDGLAYAGAGRFEVYRQGNLTWRIDTDTGTACVLFATNEEWRKPQVYRHGCGSSAVR